MATEGNAAPVAILAGGGDLPALVAAAAARGNRPPIVFAIAGEADPASFAGLPVHVIRWGEIGRLLRLLREAQCGEAVIVGGISRRPDFHAIRPDMGGLKLVPRIVKLMSSGDIPLLSGIAAMFEENGVRLVSALDVAPGLGLPLGCLVGEVDAISAADIQAASATAREVGRRDVAQGAVAVRGRAVAVEDSRGTDALLRRVATLRESGDIVGSGGVLVKCMKPAQDRRLDLPTIGPATAELAMAAGLAGVAAEAGRTLLAGRTETAEAFRRAGLFLLGLDSPPDPENV